MGMGDHQTTGAANDEWITPVEIINALGRFDLDPCAAMPRPWDCAVTNWSKHDGGLIREWSGRVWLNPPYGDAGKWMQRLAGHNQGTALLFARTETALFHDFVWKYAAALHFFRGRLHFHYVDGRRARANAGAPSVLVAYGERDAAMLQASRLPGVYVRMQQTTQQGLF